MSIQSDLTRKELIEDTITLVKGEHKKRKWKQSAWLRPKRSAKAGDEIVAKCGTSCCVAGNAAIAAGYVPVNPVIEEHFWDDCLVVDGQNWKRPKGGNVWDIRDLGKELLGLTKQEADYLFYESRRKKPIIAALEAIRDGGRVSDTKQYKRWLESQ